MITLATLAQAHAQEVFDQVARHMMTQKEKSQDNHSCLYRSDGLKCAAGCLIADEEYSKDFERKGWGGLVQEGSVPGAHELLIKDLQRVHDLKDPEEWKDWLLEVAEEYELSHGVLDDYA